MTDSFDNGRINNNLRLQNPQTGSTRILRLYNIQIIGKTHIQNKQNISLKTNLDIQHAQHEIFKNFITDNSVNAKYSIMDINVYDKLAFNNLINKLDKHI
jgi:hypothetical protein